MFSYLFYLDCATEKKEVPQPKKKFYHNVNYRIWNVKKTYHNTLLKNQSKDTEMKLLVRCKLDGCEVYLCKMVALFFLRQILGNKSRCFISSCCKA